MLRLGYKNCKEPQNQNSQETSLLKVQCYSNLTCLCRKPVGLNPQKIHPIAVLEINNNKAFCQSKWQKHMHIKMNNLEEVRFDKG